jgi:anti-anti-sigma factor
MPNATLLLDSSSGSAATSPAAFACSWRTQGGGTAWVHVAGELDIATVDHLKRTLREAQERALLSVLDLRELEFIDSCGVRAIVAASIDARRVGRRLVLLRGRPNVDRMFALTESLDDVEMGDIHPVEPPVQVLLKLAAKDGAR